MEPEKESPIHYNISAVSGMIRMACGIDNRMSGLTRDEVIDKIDGFDTNRNKVTCRLCREKINALAEYGGDAIIPIYIETPASGEDEDTKFKELVKEAMRELMYESNQQALNAWNHQHHIVTPPVPYPHAMGWRPGL